MVKNSDPSSPSGNTVSNKGVKFLEKTNKIPAKIGSVMGGEFGFRSDYHQVIEVERVWSFPKPIVSPNGGTYKELRRTFMLSSNTKDQTYYMIEDENELVLGKWEFKIYHKGKKIYHRNFYVE